MADLLKSEADVVLDGLAGDALTGAHIKPKMVHANSTQAAISAVYALRATVLSTEKNRQSFLPVERPGRLDLLDSVELSWADWISSFAAAAGS